jgi:excisionase family DNA binding protein
MPWPQKEWLTLSEVAQVLGVHPSTVRIWANQGKIPVHRTNGGHRRFRRSELELWMISRDPTHDVDIPRDFVQTLLRQVGTQMAKSDVRNLPWYSKLDEEALAQYRERGHALAQRLWVYLTGEAANASEEAKGLGYEYATLARRSGLTEGEALTAFLFFAGVVADALVEVIEHSQVQAPHVWAAMLQKIKSFVSDVAVSMLETYQAYDKGFPISS